VQHGDGAAQTAAVGFDDELGGSAPLSRPRVLRQIAGHPLKGDFDAFAEGVCQPFYARISRMDEIVAEAAMPPPDYGAGRNRLRDVLPDP
jgi:hypothetical protein